MDFAKLFQGIIVGAVVSGVLSAICTGYIAFTSNSPSSIVDGREIWWIAMLYVGFFGLIAGGILGGVVSALNLSLIGAGLFGFLITGIPGVLFYLNNRYFSPGIAIYDFERLGACFIAIATFTGVFVSFIQMSFFKSE